MESKEKVAEGKGFFFAEKDSTRKNFSPRMESKEKVAEEKRFPFAEKKSRRKNCSTRMESKEMVGERISLSRKGKQEENFFPKNGVKKRS